MAFDFKTATPEAGIVDSNLLFGALNFNEISPSVFPVSTLRDLFLGGGNLAITAGKTLTVTETMTLTALGSSQTFTFPATGGTVALLNAANIFSNATNTFGVQGSVRGTVVLANTTGANTLTLQSSNSATEAWTLTFPPDNGVNSYALTTDGSGNTAWSQVDLTTAVTNTLPVGNGGTGRTTLTVHGVLLGNTTSGINSTTAGSAGQVLVSGGASADPYWTTATFPVSATVTGTILRADGTNWVATTATYPATTTSQQLLYSSADNVIGGLTAANGGMVNYSSAGSVSVTITPTLGVQQTSRGTLTLANTAAGAYSTTIASSNSSSAAWTLTLPPDAGAAGKPLVVTDSSGTGAWSKLILTQPATAATLTIADNKTLTVNNSLTFSGTDATTMTFPATSTTVAGLSISQTFTGNNTFTGNTISGAGTTTMTDGFIYIPSASGAPSGVPTAYANRVPFYYDTSDATLYVYNGAWTSSSYELTVGVTDINSGSNGRVLYDNNGTLGEYTVTGTAGNVVLSTSPTIATPTISGNITSTGTAARFIADFNNATVNSRFAFQSATTDASTGIYALPNGTSTASSWEAANASAPTNASKILITTNGSTDVQLVSGINGTGTYLPLSIYTNGGQSAQFSTTKGTFTLGVAGTAQGILKLTGATSGTVTIQGNAAAGTWSMTLPDAVPASNGYILTSDTSGITSWTNPTALGIDLDVGTTAITNGAANRVLFQDSGNVLQESAAFTFATDTLTVGVSGTSTGYLKLANSTSAAFVQLSPVANATLQLGAPDAASPVAQTLQVQSVATGTANTSGVNFSIAGSAGTGTGNGGQIIFKTAPIGTAGSTQNTPIQAWAIDTYQTLYPAASQSTTMTKGFMNIPGGAGAPTGVPSNTTGFPMYYDSTNNYLYVYNGAWKRVSFADNFLTQE